jgi:hypothetical protein
MREKIIEQYLVQQCKAQRWECWKLTSPARRGVPDRLIILPGMVAFVEVKSPKGRLTLLQEKVLRRLKDKGQTTAVVYSKEQVDELVKTLKDALSGGCAHNGKKAVRNTPRGGQR